MDEEQPDHKGTAADASASRGTASREAAGDERRLRFVSADLDRLPGSRLRITVTLSDEGTEHRGESEGVGDRQVELRLAARAALDAVGAALGRPGFVELVGLKQIRAFDAELVLVAVRTADDPGRRLLGAVPVDGDPCRTAAVATLDAVNRVVARDLAGG